MDSRKLVLPLAIVVLGGTGVALGLVLTEPPQRPVPVEEEQARTAPRPTFPPGASPTSTTAAVSTTTSTTLRSSSVTTAATSAVRSTPTGSLLALRVAFSPASTYFVVDGTRASATETVTKDACARSGTGHVGQDIEILATQVPSSAVETVRIDLSTGPAATLTRGSGFKGAITTSQTISCDALRFDGLKTTLPYGATAFDASGRQVGPTVPGTYTFSNVD